MSTTSSSILSNQIGGRSPRFLTWVAFLIFSTITLGSTIEAVSDFQQDTCLELFTFQFNFSIECLFILNTIHFIQNTGGTL